MKSKYSTLILSAVVVFILGGFIGYTLVAAQERQRKTPEAALTAVGAGFSYQGHLEDNGSSANGSYDFEFSLYDDPGGGSQVGNTIPQTLNVSNGLFHTTLDFGADSFNGDARYLEIAVQLNGGGGFTTLSPRQAIAAVPYATYAGKVKGLDNVVTVAKSGGDYDSISLALFDIKDASPANPYLIKVGPGVYTETIDLNEYVDIEGSGEGVTIIRGLGSNTSPFTDSSSATLRSDTIIAPEVRFLTVESMGTGNDYATAIWTSGTGPYLKLTHVTARASSAAVTNIGVHIDYATPTLTFVTAAVDGGQSNRAINNENSLTIMNHVTAKATNGTASNRGIFNYYSSGTMENVQAAASGSGVSDIRAIYNFESNPTLNNVSAEASGGENATGIYNEQSDPTMDQITSRGADGFQYNFGVYNDGSSPVINNAYTKGSGGLRSYGLYNDTSFPILTNVTAVSSSSTEFNRGVYNIGSSLTVDNLNASASGGSSSIGVLNEGSSTLTIQDSQLKGTSSSISNSGGSSADVASTMLDGSVVVGGGLICTGAYNSSYVTLNENCTLPAGDPKIIHVGKAAGDYTSVSAALAAITDASASNPYLIRIGPGTYNENVDLKPYIDIEGSGQNVTILRGLGSNTAPGTDGSSATLRADGITAPEVRFLTVESDGTGKAYATAIWINDTSTNLKLTQVSAVAKSGSSKNVGIYIDNSSPTLFSIYASAEGNADNYGIENQNLSYTTLHNVMVEATDNSGTIFAYGVFNYAYIEIQNSDIRGTDGSVVNISGSGLRIANSKLSGIVSNNAGVRCVGAYDGNYYALDTACQ